MKSNFRKGFLVAILLMCFVGVMVAQAPKPYPPVTWWYKVSNWIETGSITMTNKSFTSPTITGIATIDSMAVDSLNVSGQLVVPGSAAFTGNLGHTETPAAGANVGSTFRTNLDTVAYTGTTGYKFKVYDTGTGTVHNGGEHAAVYANMKQLSAMTNGGKSVIYSGHNYGSGGNYQVIDAGVWLYGNLVDAFKISGGSIDTGLDLSETTVTGQDIELHNGATINNVHADTVSIDETVVNIGSKLTVGSDPGPAIEGFATIAVASGAERASITIGGVAYLLVAVADSADIVD